MRVAQNAKSLFTTVSLWRLLFIHPRQDVEGGTQNGCERTGLLNSLEFPLEAHRKSPGYVDSPAVSANSCSGLPKTVCPHYGG